MMNRNLRRRVQQVPPFANQLNLDRVILDGILTALEVVSRSVIPDLIEVSGIGGILVKKHPISANALIYRERTTAEIQELCSFGFRHLHMQVENDLGIHDEFRR